MKYHEIYTGFYHLRKKERKKKGRKFYSVPYILNCTYKLKNKLKLKLKTE